MIISNNPQRSPEWFADRLGKATGSKADVITAKGKTKGTESTQRRNYRFQLALERITGKSCEKQFSNEHTERGNELEKFARMAYEIQSGEMVQEAGFCVPKEGAHYGCSVDGFIDDRKGIFEAKCPIPAIHYGYIEDDRLPPVYFNQVIHNIITTGAGYCDFVSYNEDMPEKLKLFVYRFVPTQAELNAYQDELAKFLDEVNQLTNEINERAK
jgi:hypothetical protein